MKWYREACRSSAKKEIKERKYLQARTGIMVQI